MKLLKFTSIFWLCLCLMQSPIPAQLSGTGYANSQTVTESGGAATCDFAVSLTCIYVRVSGNPLTPTLTHLPKNQFVTIIFDTVTNSVGLVGVTWPSNVFCNEMDNGSVNTCVSLGTPLNGSVIGNYKYANVFWSDGTNLYLQGFSGRVQTAEAAHGNFLSVAVSGFAAGGSAGSVNMNYGSLLVSNGSTATPSFNVASCTGATATSGSSNLAGELTSLPTGSCTIVMTLGNSASYNSFWDCSLHNLTHTGTTNQFYVSANTATTITFTGTSVSGDKLHYGGCSGF